MARTQASGAADAWLDAVSEGLLADGFAVLDTSPVAALHPTLATEARRQERAGRFRHARVGRGAGLRVRPEIRSDHVLWWDPASAGRGARRMLARMDLLRAHLNRTLWLGLAGFESHFAVYPPGTRYRTHLDRFADADHRIVTVILYLNDAGWSDADGGALRLYLETPDTRPWHDVLPRGGRLVVFESGRFHHEVLPAARSRRSVVGWFTRRP